MSAGLAPGRFRFHEENTSFPVDAKKGQVSTCFAVKIAWQTGIWEEWSDERKQACIDFIRSFQTPDGFFADEWLLRESRPPASEFLRTMLKGGSIRGLIERRGRNLRAETRQSAATLMMVCEGPEFPLPVPCRTAEEVDEFFFSFDWSDPWSAGSHISHVITFLSINKRLFRGTINYDVETVLSRIRYNLDRIRDQETGSWHRGKTSHDSMVNGAMKVLSGLRWLDFQYPECTRLLDFALSRPFAWDGCRFLNRLFVVRESLRGCPPGYRQEDVIRLGEEVLEIVQQFRKKDGAFSFFIDGSQTGYYGFKVGKKLPISDLHGTVMITWAVALALELCDRSKFEGAEMWRAPKV